MFVQADITAGRMIFNVDGVDPERRAFLIQLLDIDIYQSLTSMSDGQRRRVQICMGLMKLYDVSSMILRVMLISSHSCNCFTSAILVAAFSCRCCS